MSLRQKLAPLGRRSSFSTTTAPTTGGLTRVPSRPTGTLPGSSSTIHTTSPNPSILSTAPLTPSSAPLSATTPGSSSLSTTASTPSAASFALWAKSSSANGASQPVETWWGTQPCPVALGTPTGTLFDGPARAPGAARPKMRWDFEDYAEGMPRARA